MFTYYFISSSKTPSSPRGSWIAQISTEGFFLGGQRGFALLPTDFVPELDTTVHGCWSQGGHVQLMFDSFLIVNTFNFNQKKAGNVPV